MQRKALLQQLATYVPQYPEGHTFKAQFIHFVQQHEHCFERSLSVGHVTGSAWIIDTSCTYALLLHHRKLGRWLQPGGHADGNPDVLAVALKEAEEESGLQGLTLAQEGIFDIDIHSIPARQGEPEHLHYDVRYLFKADRREVLQINHESKGLEWVAFEHIENKVAGETSIMRMLEKSKHMDRSNP